MRLTQTNAIRSLVCAMAVLPIAACGGTDFEVVKADLSSDINMTWVEKYITYEQDHDGQLTMTDVHFLAEIIFDGERDFDAISAEVTRHGESRSLATYGGRDKRALTNGYYYTRKSRSFDHVDALEAAHPADSTYSWDVDGPAGQAKLAPIRIGGPQSVSQFPAVSTIRLLQESEYVSDLVSIDVNQPMTIEWDPFEIGGPLTGTKWNDLVFVLISDCHGHVVFTAGAPGTDKDFADYDETFVVMPERQLSAGQDYTIFISQVNYVDHNESYGITQLAANSFAVELDVRTAGANEVNDCPQPPTPAQYLWSRKTVGDDMESWPTVADY